MSVRLFLFVQFEFPWELGPPDGRYLLRAPGSDEPEHVVVLATLGAARRSGLGGGGRPRARRRAVPVEPEAPPTAVPVARATVVDPVSLAADQQARAWLKDFDNERDVGAAAAVLNRVLYLHRIACADPYIHEVSPAQALAIRAGWGEGVQVADGHWLEALDLPSIGKGQVPGRWPGGRRYSAALRTGERLAQLLGGRAEPLACEELTLRARLDLDQRRVRHAAIELATAYNAALPELHAEERGDLAVRIAELEELAPAVQEQRRAALDDSAQEPSEEVVRHALERLEAALRARTATGLG
ncbi:MAG TPA: hypothetical protein VNZ05_08495 [Solirubrobacteraceae bacterium]|nr:hypothetical protein [Solirubrobacteraceae bacterium]